MMLVSRDGSNAQNDAEEQAVVYKSRLLMSLPPQPNLEGSWEGGVHATQGALSTH